MVYDPSQPYNAMQAAAGLPPPQVIFPGQVSAAIAAQGGVAAYNSLFPTQTYQTAVGASPIFQGPTGLMAQMNPSAPFNPYAPANPFAGLSSYGNLSGRASPFAAYAPQPPPAYGGFQGVGALPFAPAAAPGAFDTPFGSSVAQSQASHMRGWTAGQSMMGSAAHFGGNMLGAGAGALVGGAVGGPFGAMLGGTAGFLGAERLGIGRAAQNAYGNAFITPRLAEMGAAQGIEHLSQRFMASGSRMHASGSGMSFHSSLEAAQGLGDMANSSDFRRDTRGRFNQQDIYRMTQLSGENGMLSGASNPQAMVSRMKDIAKSLSAFMEIAKEPDVMRAIQTMGSLRGSGLNLHETMGAVAQGRSFARMAGTTFQGLADAGGALGSQVYQSSGLSQGLGFQSGMASYGQASASMNQNILNPQISSLVGGREGLSTLNSMYSASQLQLPMAAPGLMSSRGGLDASAMRGYLSGNSNLFDMTSRGASTLSGMAGQMGVGGLGMAIGMQPMIQDTIGRVLQSRGQFAGRNMEDRNIVNMMRQMGLSGSSGFMTAAHWMMGMQGTAATARATELQSGAYWETQRDQLTTNQREARADADRERAANQPRILRSLRQNTALGDVTSAVGQATHHLGVSASRFFGGEESMDGYGEPTTDEGRRRLSRMYGSAGLRQYLSSLPGEEENLSGHGALGAYGVSRRLARAGGQGSVSSSISGLFGGSAAYRQQAAQDLRDGGQYASQVLSATPEERAASMSRLSSTFGGMQGLLGFTERASQMASAAYSPGSVALSRISGGAFGGPSAMRGSQLREAFAAQLRQQGVSESEINRRWTQERPAITQQHATFLGAFSMSESEDEVWRTTADQSSNYGGGGSRLRRVRADADSAYRRLLGDVGREGQEGFRSVMDAAEGFGAEGTQRNDRTRRLIGGMAMAQIAGRGGGRGAQEQGRRRMSELIQQALQQGVSHEDIQMATERARGLRTQFQDNAGVLSAARGFVNQGRGMAGLAEGEDARLRDTASRNVLAGFRQYAGGGGTLSSVFRGLTEDNFSEAEVGSRIRGMSAAQRRALRNERGMSGVADSVDKIFRGDNSGISSLFGQAGRYGEQSERLRREYDTTEGDGLMGRFRRWTGTYDSARDRWVRNQQRTTSSGERSADQQRSESIDAEGQTRGAGLGVAGDQLLDAARELREVARTFRDVNQSSHMNDMLRRPM